MAKAADAAAPRPGFWRRHAATALLLVVALGLYAPTLRHGFVWDDHDFIEANPAVRSPGLLGRVPALLGLGFTSSPFDLTAGPYYRPLVVLSLAVDSRLGGGRPFAFHLTNLALNAAAVLLVHELLRRMRCGEPWAFLGALLFAVHPVHVESVAWIVGRTDVLATVWFLVAWLAFRTVAEADRAGVPSAGGRRAVAPAPAPLAWWTPVLAPAAFSLAALSKEFALVLPLLLLPELGRTGRRTRLAYLALLGVAALYALLRMHALAGAVPAGAATGLAERILRAPLVLGRALGPLLWPWAPCPVYDATGATVPVLAGLAAVAAPAVAALASARARRRLAPLARPALLYALALLPVSGIVPLPVPFAERYLYLPTVALVWALAVVAQGVARSGGAGRGRLVALVLGLLAAAGAVRTVTYAPVWRDDVALFSRILVRWPQSVPALNELGVAWSDRGEPAKARPPLERAVRLAPNFAPAHFNLARVLEAQRDTTAAVGELRATLRLQPNATGVPRHLVRLLAGAGRAAEAAPDLERAAATGSAEAAALLRELRGRAGNAVPPAPPRP
jgi:protein O-mannosyl-transferase